MNKAQIVAICRETTFARMTALLDAIVEGMTEDLFSMPAIERTSTAARRVDWRNLYAAASGEEWSGMYCACNRRTRTRGPAYTPSPKPIATIADVWPA